MARRAAARPLVMTKAGTARLDDEAGLAGLLPAGIAPAHLAGLIRRVIDVPTAGDLVVYGASLAPDRVVTFEPELGSHGGSTPRSSTCSWCRPTGFSSRACSTWIPAELGRELRRRYVTT